MTPRQFIRAQLREALLGDTHGLRLVARAVVVGYFTLLTVASIPQLVEIAIGAFQ